MWLSMGVFWPAKLYFNMIFQLIPPLGYKPGWVVSVQVYAWESGRGCKQCDNASVIMAHQGWGQVGVKVCTRSRPGDDNDDIAVVDVGASCRSSKVSR